MVNHAKVSRLPVVTRSPHHTERDELLADLHALLLSLRAACGPGSVPARLADIGMSMIESDPEH